MPWWVWLIPAAGGFLFLFRLLSKPEYHTHISFDHLGQFVQQFVYWNKAGSVMLLEREGSAGLLQIKIKEVGPAGAAVEIGMPEVDWSAAAFAEIESRLKESGLDTHVGDGRGCSTVRKFLRASASGDEDSVVAHTMTAVDIVGAALGWKTATFTVHHEVGWRSRVER